MGKQQQEQLGAPMLQWRQVRFSFVPTIRGIIRE